MRPINVVLMASAAKVFTKVINVPSSYTGVNLRDLANAQGYDGGNTNIIFNLEAGTTVRGTGDAASAGGIAMDTGPWPAGKQHKIEIVNKNGAIIDGGGGAGGSDGAGYAGGHAINCQVNIKITNQAGGTIRGGAGGGGSGQNYTSIAGSGGDIWVAHAGDGGAGGFPNGTGGVGSYYSTVDYNGDPIDSTGANGPNGTVGGGGAGNMGAGARTGGGAGGNAGQAGYAGGNGSYAGGAGGAAGKAIAKNGYVVTVVNAGTITGTQA